MRVKVILFLLTCGLAVSPFTQVTAEELGCEQVGQNWRCADFQPVMGVDATFVDDVYCGSSDQDALRECDTNCSDVVNIGCMTTIRIEEPIKTKMRYVITGPNTYETDEEPMVIQEGEYDAVVNNDLIDWSRCAPQRVGGAYAYMLVCAYNGTKMTFDGTFTTDGETIIFQILQKAAPPRIVPAYLSYAAISVIALLIAFWLIRRRPKRRRIRSKV